MKSYPHIGLPLQNMLWSQMAPHIIGNASGSSPRLHCMTQAGTAASVWDTDYLLAEGKGISEIPHVTSTYIWLDRAGYMAPNIHQQQQDYNSTAERSIRGRAKNMFRATMQASTASLSKPQRFQGTEIHAAYVFDHTAITIESNNNHTPPQSPLKLQAKRQNNLCIKARNHDENQVMNKNYCTYTTCGI